MTDDVINIPRLSYVDVARRFDYKSTWHNHADLCSCSAAVLDKF